MSDIVERLREMGDYQNRKHVLEGKRLEHEAAAEIERLRAALEPFAFFADILVPQIDITCGNGFYKSLQNARAALEEGRTEAQRISTGGDE